MGTLVLNRSNEIKPKPVDQLLEVCALGSLTLGIPEGLSAALIGAVGQLRLNLIEEWSREFCVLTVNPTPIIRRAWDKYREPAIHHAGFIYSLPLN